MNAVSAAVSSVLAVVVSTISAQEQRAAPSSSRAQVVVVSSETRESAKIGRDVKTGSWLAVSIRVTPPAGGFEATPVLSGAVPDQSAKFAGISPEASTTASTLFADYGKDNFGTNVGNWARLEKTGSNPSGRLGGGVYMGLGRPNPVDFHLTLLVRPDGRIEFGRRTTDSAAIQLEESLTLLFDIAGIKGPYRLALGDVIVPVIVK